MTTSYARTAPLTALQTAALRQQSANRQYRDHLDECESAATTGPCRTCWHLDSEAAAADHEHARQLSRASASDHMHGIQHQRGG